MEDLKEEIREKGTFEVLTREVEKLLAQEKEKKTEAAAREECERLGKLAEELRQTIGRVKIADELEKTWIPNELTAVQVTLAHRRAELFLREVTETNSLQLLNEPLGL